MSGPDSRSPEQPQEHADPAPHHSDFSASRESPPTGTYQVGEDDIELCQIGRTLQTPERSLPPCPLPVTTALVITDRDGLAVPLCADHFSDVTGALDRLEQRVGEKLDHLHARVSARPPRRST